MLAHRRLSVRRITHHGKKLRERMLEIGGEFGARVRYAAEESALLAQCGYNDKNSYIYNMDQTAVYMDMCPARIIYFNGSKDVDVAQSMSPNSFRASVFLCASATGRKLPQLVVFAGKQQGQVHQEVVGFSDRIVAAVQANAYADECVMLEWIDNVSFWCIFGDLILSLLISKTFVL